MRAIFDGLMLQWLSESDLEATFEKYRERCERELLRYLQPLQPPQPGDERKGGPQ